ncbi:MAG TPA: hypothetical protein VFM82_07500, partial [Flavobacteriaceae bacterium]|nr:hypothetical protein [Flavobacteriaceae bacterium]
MKNYAPFFLFLLFVNGIFAQEIELYTQFNGHYDYTAIGNTMNTAENNGGPCTILTSSAADLNLASGQNVVAAYLYWAGSGPGDFDVSLNGTAITAERTFSHSLDPSREFFAAFTDVSSQIIAEGNTTYTLSDLDLTSVIPNYCPSGTNFAGWSIIIVYEDMNLPLNQLSIYDGLRGVSIDNNMLTFTLDNLNVIDNQGAKIGFLAWEGDESLSVEETLQINGNIVSNPPLNPADNAFNSTNSFTGSNVLYNMDIDYYDIENNIQIGDTSAQITLTSGNGIISSDFVMINNIVTVLNSQLPDASVVIDQVQTSCNSRSIQVDYTIQNFNCTDFLPANTAIAFYADGILVATAFTQNDIPIGGTETGSISINIPTSIPENFELQIVVDDDGTGTGSVTEINEDNNSDSIQVQLLNPQIIGPLEDLIACGEEPDNETEIFDLSVNSPLAIGNQTNVSVEYFTSQTAADSGVAEITDFTNYENTSNPQEIFIRVETNEDPNCYVTGSFLLTVYPTPFANAPEAFEVCDSYENDGTAVFNLELFSSEIIGTQQNVNLSFYEDENAALSGTNPISDTEQFENTQNPQTIYVRVENDFLNDCFSITSFTLSVRALDPIVVLCRQEKCDEGMDTATFDFNYIASMIFLGANQEITGYYTSVVDADNQMNPIWNISD